MCEEPLISQTRDQSLAGVGAGPAEALTAQGLWALWALRELLNILIGAAVTAPCAFVKTHITFTKKKHFSVCKLS